MSDSLLIPIAVLYLLLMGMLFIYGLNFYYMTGLALSRKETVSDESGEEADRGVLPCVTVQLPIYNELYVAERLIEAALRLDYPIERLEIQVLDDSTDGTRTIIDRAVMRGRAAGVDIRVLRRDVRTGYKAGALAAGLAQARGELLAIFDADFIPPPEFLQRTIHDFTDPRLAFVQARWGHTNSSYSFLTFLQSLAIDAHFMVEQQARSSVGFWFNFNGTAGVWRRAAVEAVGGWQARTLTEDLDLSYRAFLQGWHGRYYRDLSVPAELPATFNGFRQQQSRWATGSFQCARLLLPEVWRSATPLGHKLSATLHLLGYGVHLLLFGLCALYPLVLVLSARFPQLITLFGVALAFNITALAPTAMFLAAQHMQNRRLSLKMGFVLLFISAFGSGMMLNTLRAAWRAWRTEGGEFQRTPKHGIIYRSQRLEEGTYWVELDRIAFFELAFGIYNLVTVVLALRLGNWFVAFYASLFGCGLLFTALYSILQTVSLTRARAVQAVERA